MAHRKHIITTFIPEGPAIMIGYQGTRPFLAVGNQIIPLTVDDVDNLATGFTIVGERVRPITMTVPNEILTAMKEEMAALFKNSETAANVLQNAGYPVSRIPAFNAPGLFWPKVVEEASNGALPPVRILRAAIKQFPHNVRLSQLLAALTL